jgi:hypothetical protein
MRTSKHQQYRAYAAHCLEMAKYIPDQTSRNVQREMAAEWLSLADVLSLKSEVVPRSRAKSVAAADNGL